MILELDHGFSIKTDGVHNFILRRRVKSTKNKNKEPTYRDTILGYYGWLDHALHAYLNKLALTDESTYTAEELLNQLRTWQEEISQKLPHQDVTSDEEQESPQEGDDEKAVLEESELEQS